MFLTKVCQNTHSLCLWAAQLGQVDDGVGGEHVAGKMALDDDNEDDDDDDVRAAVAQEV